MRRSPWTATSGLPVVLAVAACVGSACAIPSVAGAQQRAGVPLDALRSALRGPTAGPSAVGELTIGEIEVPGEGALPVRLALVRAGQPVALLDVQVLGSHDEARAWIADRAPAISSAPVTARSRELYADTQSGRAGLVMIARANVALVVRVLDDGLDAAAIAEAVCAVIDAAPAGPRAPRTIEPPRPEALAVGASLPVQLPSWAIAARVIAGGGGYARRTPRGWMITRTSAEPITVRVVAVDADLRVTR